MVSGKSGSNAASTVRRKSKTTKNTLGHAEHPLSDSVNPLPLKPIMEHSLHNFRLLQTAVTHGFQLSNDVKTIISEIQNQCGLLLQNSSQTNNVQVDVTVEPASHQNLENYTERKRPRKANKREQRRTRQSASIELVHDEVHVDSNDDVSTESAAVVDAEFNFREIKDNFDINMRATEIKTQCDSLNFQSISNPRLIAHDDLTPPMQNNFSEISLHPETFEMTVESREELFSDDLKRFCMQHPIVCIRKAGQAVNLDFELFQTVTLANISPSQHLELRLQHLQASDDNRTINGIKTWHCYSERSMTTLQEYADYQNSQRDLPNIEQSNINKSTVSGKSKKKRKFANAKFSKTRYPKMKIIRFGTNFDISDETIFRDQLRELEKFPPFLRVAAQENLLTHVNQKLAGINSVQVFLKVAGCRTPCHQENLNIASINLNVGPGECVWYAIDKAYLGNILRICKKKRVKFLKSSFWPIIKDLERDGIPVFQIIQRSGDLMWINASCIHFVQAKSTCNNISFNVAMATPDQYTIMLERYEWNKLQKFQSLVPLIRLSWGVAQSYKVMNRELFRLIKTTLMRSLLHCWQVLSYLRHKKINITEIPGTVVYESDYCCKCLVELFNVTFVSRNNDNKRHCWECASKAGLTMKSFKCILRHSMNELMEIYDKFTL